MDFSVTHPILENLGDNPTSGISEETSHHSGSDPSMPSYKEKLERAEAVLKKEDEILHQASHLESLILIDGVILREVRDRVRVLTAQIDALGSPSAVNDAVGKVELAVERLSASLGLGSEPMVSKGESVDKRLNLIATRLTDISHILQLSQLRGETMIREILKATEAARARRPSQGTASHSRHGSRPSTSGTAAPQSTAHSRVASPEAGVKTSNTPSGDEHQS